MNIHTSKESYLETIVAQMVKERDALDAEATRLSDHATELRTRRDKLAAENKTLRDALERTLTALENEGPTFWSAEQDAARAALQGVNHERS